MEYSIIIVSEPSILIVNKGGSCVGDMTPCTARTSDGVYKSNEHAQYRIGNSPVLGFRITVRK